MRRRGDKIGGFSKNFDDGLVAYHAHITNHGINPESWTEYDRHIVQILHAFNKIGLEIVLMYIPVKFVFKINGDINTTIENIFKVIQPQDISQLVVGKAGVRITLEITHSNIAQIAKDLKSNEKDLGN